MKATMRQEQVKEGEMEDLLLIDTRGYRISRGYDLCLMQKDPHRNWRELSAKS